MKTLKGRPTLQAGTPQVRNGESRWRAEWAADPELEREFGDFQAYAAYKAADGAGLVTICGTKAAPTTSRRAADRQSATVITAEDRRRWRAEFAANPKLQAEFGDCEAYAAYKRADDAGLVTICGTK